MMWLCGRLLNIIFSEHSSSLPPQSVSFTKNYKQESDMDLNSWPNGTTVIWFDESKLEILLEIMDAAYSRQKGKRQSSLLPSQFRIQQQFISTNEVKNLHNDEIIMKSEWHTVDRFCSNIPCHADDFFIRKRQAYFRKWIPNPIVNILLQHALL